MPTSEVKVVPPHKINVRQFISYRDDEMQSVKLEKRQARRDLLYFVAKKDQ